MTFLTLLIKFFINFSMIFFIDTKMPENSSAKFYQENKENWEKKLAKDIQIFLKKKEKKIL